MQVQRFELLKNILCLVNTANLAHLFLVWPRFLPFPSLLNIPSTDKRNVTDAQSERERNISTALKGRAYIYSHDGFKFCFVILPAVCQQ